MSFLKVILQIGILYVFLMLGNGLKMWLSIPLPGSIIGLLLLLAALTSRILPVQVISKGSGFLLAILPLLLVPPTVGVMNYPSLFTGKGIFIFLTVVLCTVITITITAKTSQLLEERAHKGKESKVCSKQVLP